MMMHISRMRLFVLVGVFATASLTWGQEQADQDDVQETRVMSIRHADPAEVIDLIDQIRTDLPVVLAQVGDSNHVILQGPASAVEQVDRFIAELDERARLDEEVDRGADTRFIRIESYPIEELINVIAPFAGEPDVRYAIDPVNHHLILSGYHEKLRQLEAIVEALDRPQEAWTITLTFLRADMARGEQPMPDDDLPAYLAPAAEALHEAGFARLQLLAPVMVRVNSGEHFSQHFTRMFNMDGKSETLEFVVRGEARFESGAERINLELGARMQGIVRTGVDKKSHPEEAWFEVDTTLTAPIGRSIVLSAAPSTTSQGEAIALVARVTRE